MAPYTMRPQPDPTRSTSSYQPLSSSPAPPSYTDSMSHQSPSSRDRSSSQAFTSSSLSSTHSGVSSNRSGLPSTYSAFPSNHSAISRASFSPDLLSPTWSPDGSSSRRPSSNRPSSSRPSSSRPSSFASVSSRASDASGTSSKSALSKTVNAVTGLFSSTGGSATRDARLRNKWDKKQGLLDTLTHLGRPQDVGISTAAIAQFKDEMGTLKRLRQEKRQGRHLSENEISTVEYLEMNTDGTYSSLGRKWSKHTRRNGGPPSMGRP